MDRAGQICNTDWIFSPESNVHVATDMGWFDTTTFVQFTGKRREFHEPDTTAYSLDIKLKGKWHAVKGIGSVILHPKRKPSESRSGRKHLDMHLHQVLFIPTFPINVLGAPITAKLGIVTDSYGKTFFVNESLAFAGHLDAAGNGQKKLTLAGQLLGSSSSTAETPRVTAVWTDTQRAAYCTMREEEMQDREEFKEKMKRREGGGGGGGGLIWGRAVAIMGVVGLVLYMLS